MDARLPMKLTGYPAADQPTRIAVASSYSPVWWLSFLSLTGFVLGTRLGSLAMAVCLGTWGLYMAAWPDRCWRWLEAYRLPLLLPVFAIASALWSIEPGISFKLGIEFLAFTAMGIVASRAQTLRSLISSFMCALLVGVLLSAALRTTAVIGTTGEIALIGVFGSKNNLASFVCLSMISSISVLLDRKQPRSLRGLALVGLILDPVVLIKAHSLGALLAGGAAIATTLAFILLSRLSFQQRSLILPLMAILTIGFAGFVALAFQQGFDLSSILAAAGKDVSLTGRTFLWSRARDYISIRPLLGVGYQSFWVQGHVEAEALWRFAQIQSRSGFHFHNLYYETAVELGQLGVAILGLSLVLSAASGIRSGFARPCCETAFLCGLIVFYAIRLSVELDFLDPFSPGSFLLPAIWVYSCHRRDRRPDRQF